MFFSGTINLETEGRGIFEITDEIQEIVADSKVRNGICVVFLHHTSASLILCENADPSVRRDLERFFSRLVPDGHPEFRHTAEGPDDMPAHVRTILTQNSMTLPVAKSRCDLGTWQGVYVWEHRTSPHRRRITLSVLGEPFP